MTDSKHISIVIPLFNEVENLASLNDELTKTLSDLSFDFEIIYVNDGSTDGSLEVVKELNAKDPRVNYISFSKNYGHQTALKAGLDHATGNAVISLDADHQHPVSKIPELINKWQEGYEIVYTVREDDDELGWFKKFTSKQFYKLINNLSETKIEPGTADFRLLDEKIIRIMREYKEDNLFLRGIIPSLGFNQISVPYKANPRFKGQTKYSLKKMIQLAVTGITSLSPKPLYLSIYLGVCFAMISFIYGIFAIYIKLFTDQAVEGWASVVASILFIGGFQLMVLGVMGIYLGKLFIESKNRPNYIVAEKSL